MALLSSQLFTRILGATLVANVLALAVCNLSLASLHSLFWIYPVCFICGAWPLIRAHTKRMNPVPTMGMVVWMLFFWGILTGLRLPYVLDWIPGNIVLTEWDDDQRLPGLISMTLSDAFPLAHFANQDYLYAYYYASIIPWALLKLALPVLTLKNVIFLGNAFYFFLILMSLLEVGSLMLPSRRSLWVFVFLVTAFGGLDWAADVVFNQARFIDHHEWWQTGARLGGNAQVSSFFNAMFWSSNHFLGCYACIVAYVVMRYYRFRNKAVKSCLAVALLLSGFYSSVFAFLPVALLAALNWKIVLKRFLRPTVVVLGMVVLAAPLFMYLNKPSAVHFEWAGFAISFCGNAALNKLFSFPVWLILLVAVEFAGIPLLALAMVKHFTSVEKRMFLGSWLFCLSTYIIGFSWHNNYSMRGMLLPTFIFFVLFAKYIEKTSFLRKLFCTRAAACALAVLFALGTALEARNLVWMSARTMSKTYELMGWEGSREKFPFDYQALARDRSRKVHERGADVSMRCYNAEKFIQIPLDQMVEEELVQMTLLSAGEHPLVAMLRAITSGTR